MIPETPIEMHTVFVVTGVPIIVSPLVTLLFWFSMGFVIYSYFGYPLFLILISMFSRKRVSKAALFPRVSFIITAYNEGERIEQKLQNTLALVYPREKLEIIVASDCSTDRTDEIVRSYEGKGVKLVRAAERRGKENAQKHAIEAASGEIFVFSDVATILEPDGVSSIVQNFADPTVGCVSSEDRFIDPEGKISGEGAYVRYEMVLRQLESRVSSVVGLSGSFFAARREVCFPWAADLQSDFSVLLNARRMGLRGISDPNSVGYYANLARGSREFERKVRTVLRGISVVMRNLSLLNPFRYRLFAWQLFSHKICRWMNPVFLLVLLISSLLLIFTSPIYLIFALVQVLFYLLALGGTLVGRLVSGSLLRIPAYFVAVNLSIVVAWYRYVKGDRLVAWDPSRR